MKVACKRLFFKVTPELVRAGDAPDGREQAAVAVTAGRVDDADEEQRQVSPMKRMPFALRSNKSLDGGLL